MKKTEKNGMSIDEARAYINSLLERGIENITAEIVTAYGLEDEYPDLIAKVDSDAAALYNRK